MRLVPRLALASALVLVLAACQTVLSESRVAPGDEVRVSASYDELDDRCPPGTTVDIYLDDEPEPVASGVAGEDGNFDIPFSAPQAPGSYEVTAVCVLPELDLPEIGPIGPVLVFFDPATLVVEPVLAMAAEPTLLDPAEEFTVTGNFCVSESATSDPPEVTVSFEGTDETVVADEAQPFDGEWTVDFTAPDEAGTYDVTASCVYDDEPGEEPENGDDENGFDAVSGPATVASDGVSAAADSEPQPYPVVQVTVVVDEEPVVTTTTTTTTPAPAAPAAPPATAPAAAPAAAQPTFVG